MNDYFLADDLSGALDAGAAFHHAGKAVRIVLRGDAWGEALPGEVVGITTETRNTSPAQAGQTVSGMLAEGRRRNARLRYKKIDSTLRGPVAAELRAVLDGLPEVRVLLAPANPAVGRTVRDGVLLVDGVPVAQTAFGRDPGWPLRTSVVREILGSVNDSRIVIPDVATDADLFLATESMSAAGGEWIGIGSGGLARAIAGPRAAPPRGGADLEVPASAVLLVGGSAHPQNRRQAARLCALHGTASVELDFAHPRRGAGLAGDLLNSGRDVCLTLPSLRAGAELALRTVVEAAAEAVTTAGVCRVFATGGETAFALCERLGLRTVQLAGEIEPGLVVAVGSSPKGKFQLAVKPGGFGDEDTWIRAWRALRT